ncbi:MAG: hypothetical protein H3C48_17785 [Chitinophagaceae bacterium]|nr:hypothetical protein [Chitinophagaceae bacterium]
MFLQISSAFSTGDMQLAFSQMFPFLRIEFSDPGRSLHSPMPNEVDYLNSGERMAVTDGVIEIKGDTKVKDLELTLSNLFLQSARIFRRSGNIWLETSMTDNWTLEQQNEHGREISTQQ